MKIINNPHDVFFKETMSNIDTARDFVSNYLPENILNMINTDEMEIVKGSFVEKDLQGTFSDLLYKVRIRDKVGCIYVLFEHKSYPVRLIALQLLKYITGIWSLLTKQKNTGNDEKLPLIIPVVFYHGKAKWNISQKLSGLLEEIPEELVDYCPDFKYVLCDLSKHSDEELQGRANLRIFLELTKHVFTAEFEEKLHEVLRLFRELEDKEAGLEYFETVIRYIFNTRVDLAMEDLEEAVKQIVPERSENLVTIAQRLRKEGREEGREEELKKTVMLQLAKKFKTHILPEGITQKIKLANMEQLGRIRENIFEIEKLDDVTKYL